MDYILLNEKLDSIQNVSIPFSSKCYCQAELHMVYNFWKYFSFFFFFENRLLCNQNNFKAL